MSSSKTLLNKLKTIRSILETGSPTSQDSVDVRKKVSKSKRNHKKSNRKYMLKVKQTKEEKKYQLYLETCDLILRSSRRSIFTSFRKWKQLYDINMKIKREAQGSFSHTGTQTAKVNHQVVKKLKQGHKPLANIGVDPMFLSEQEEKQEPEHPSIDFEVEVTDSEDEIPPAKSIELLRSSLSKKSYFIDESSSEDESDPIPFRAAPSDSDSSPPPYVPIYKRKNIAYDEEEDYFDVPEIPKRKVRIPTNIVNTLNSKPARQYLSDNSDDDQSLFKVNASPSEKSQKLSSDDDLLHSPKTPKQSISPKSSPSSNRKKSYSSPMDDAVIFNSPKQKSLINQEEESFKSSMNSSSSRKSQKKQNSVQSDEDSLYVRASLSPRSQRKEETKVSSNRKSPKQQSFSSTIQDESEEEVFVSPVKASPKKQKSLAKQEEETDEEVFVSPVKASPKKQKSLAKQEEEVFVSPVKASLSPKSRKEEEPKVTSSKKAMQQLSSSMNNEEESGEDVIISPASSVSSRKKQNSLIQEEESEEELLISPIKSPKEQRRETPKSTGKKSIILDDDEFTKKSQYNDEELQGDSKQLPKSIQLFDSSNSDKEELSPSKMTTKRPPSRRSQRSADSASNTPAKKSPQKDVEQSSILNEDDEVVVFQEDSSDDMLVVPEIQKTSTEKEEIKDNENEKKLNVRLFKIQTEEESIDEIDIMNSNGLLNSIVEEEDVQLLEEEEDYFSIDQNLTKTEKSQQSNDPDNESEKDVMISQNSKSVISSFPSKVVSPIISVPSNLSDDDDQTFDVSKQKSFQKYSNRKDPSILKDTQINQNEEEDLLAEVSTELQGEYLDEDHFSPKSSTKSGRKWDSIKLKRIDLDELLNSDSDPEKELQAEMEKKNPLFTDLPDEEYQVTVPTGKITSANIASEISDDEMKASSTIHVSSTIIDGNKEDEECDDDINALLASIDEILSSQK